MSALKFSLAQIEAFVSVVESGSLALAARQLHKDRTTLSELIDYLELDLGFSLFDRSVRPMKASPEGMRLYRQARLLLLEAQAFGEAAGKVPDQLADAMTIYYDVFVPRAFLLRLGDLLRTHGVEFDLVMSTREEAEAALEEGRADVAFHQAINRPVGAKMAWQSVGAIEVDFYAAPALFPSSPVSLRMLAAAPQLMPYASLSPQMAQRMQIADRVRVVTEPDLLLDLLAHGHGWAMLPTHMDAPKRAAVVALDTDIGSRGLAHPVVALWKPGTQLRPALALLLERAGQAWQDAMHP